MSLSFDLSGFGDPVPVKFTKETSKDQLEEFPAFKTWVTTLKSSLDSQTQADHPFREAPYKLKSVTIQSVDHFGKDKVTNKPKLGFVKLLADIRNAKGEYLPGISFLRGGSVAMLMILRPSDSRNERWVIMTEQPRIPAGSLRFLEIPAGMMDNNKTFIGAAAEEIEEETGLKIPPEELIDLTKLALADAEGVVEDLKPAMYPSPGGSDEFIGIMLWEKVMDRQEIEDLKGKLTGLRTQGEKITVRILNYEKLWRVGARDAKTMAAWALYEALKRARHPDLLHTPSW
jgi:ADP-sugar diphosphatase